MEKLLKKNIYHLVPFRPLSAEINNQSGPKMISRSRNDRKEIEYNWLSTFFPQHPFCRMSFFLNNIMIGSTRMSI